MRQAPAGSGRRQPCHVDSAEVLWGWIGAIGAWPEAGAVTISAPKNALTTRWYNPEIIMTYRRLTRRNFLKSTGLAAGGLFLPPPPPDGLVRTPVGLGRAVRGLYIYSKPSFDSDHLNFLAADSVFDLYGVVESPDDLLNKRWHRV